MSPNILPDLRLDIGDESPASGVYTSQNTPISFLRLDVGDESVATGAIASGTLSFVDDIRVDIGDDTASVTGSYTPSGIQSLADLRVDTADDVGTAVSYSVPTILSPTPVGFVVGPVGATTNAVARFADATGGVIKNSPVTIGDDGVITTPGGMSVGGIINGLYRFREVTAAGDVVITNEDNVVFINKTVPEATNVYLPNNCGPGHYLTIKDFGGVAAAFNITLNPTLGTIDGFPSNTLLNAWQSVTLIWSGSAWGII